MIFAKRQVAALIDSGINCELFLLSSRTSLRTLCSEWHRLKSAVLRFQPDVLHAHFGTVTALFTVLASPVPVVITYRGSDLNPCPSMPRLRWWVGRLLSQLAALRASQLICVSEELRDRLWWKHDRVTVVPTGVDTGRFYPRDRLVARRELGWNADDKIVLFNAGSSPDVKRLDLAQAAFEHARTTIDRLRLVVMSGDIDPAVVPTMMNAADCILLTSDYEGSPTVVQEAIACNLPVVSVEVGDVRDRLSGVDMCRIVERDPDSLGCAIIEVLTQGRRSDGRVAVQAFSMCATLQKTIAVYRSALLSAHRDQSVGCNA